MRKNSWPFAFLFDSRVNFTKVSLTASSRIEESAIDEDRKSHSTRRL